MKKRIFALLLAFALIISCLPAGVLAEGVNSDQTVVEQTQPQEAQVVVPEQQEEVISYL